MQLWRLKVQLPVLLISIAFIFQPAFAAEGETSSALEKSPTDDSESTNAEIQEENALAGAEASKTEDASLQAVGDNNEPLPTGEEKKKDSNGEQASTSGKKKKKGRRRNKTRKRKQKTTTPIALPIIPTSTPTATTTTSTTTTKPTSTTTTPQTTTTTPTTTTSTSTTTTTTTPMPSITTTTPTPCTPTVPSSLPQEGNTEMKAVQTGSENSNSLNLALSSIANHIQQGENGSSLTFGLSSDTKTPQLPSVDSSPQSRSLISSLLGSSNVESVTTRKPVQNPNDGTLEAQLTVSNENKMIDEPSQPQNNTMSNPINFISVKTFSAPLNSSQGSAYSYESKASNLPGQTMTNTEYSSSSDYAPPATNSQPAMPETSFSGQNSFQFPLPINPVNQFIPPQTPYAPYNQFVGQNPLAAPWSFQNSENYASSGNNGVSGNPYARQGNSNTPYGQPGPENSYSNNFPNPYNSNSNPGNTNSYGSPAYGGGQFAPNNQPPGLVNGILNPLIRGVNPMFQNRMMNSGMFSPYNPPNMPLHSSNRGPNPQSSQYQGNPRNLGNSPVQHPPRLYPQNNRSG